MVGVYGCVCWVQYGLAANHLRTVAWLLETGCVPSNLQRITELGSAVRPSSSDPSPSFSLPSELHHPTGLPSRLGLGLGLG